MRIHQKTFFTYFLVFIASVATILIVKVGPFAKTLQREKALAFLEGLPPYGLDIKKTLIDYLKEIESLYPLSSYGGGGEFEDEMFTLYLTFLSKKNLDPKEAKHILQQALLLLKEKINSNERIIPFLDEFPMNENRLSLYIQTPDDSFYSSVELFPENQVPLESRNDKKIF